jgi:hypothetical protein
MIAIAISRHIIALVSSRPVCTSHRVQTKELAPREWARTTDLTVNSRPLYQLSYRGMERADGIEPSSSSGKMLLCL